MNLKQYIEENNLRISEISAGAGIPYSTVCELVNGKKSMGKCNAQTVYTLAKYFNTTMEELLTGDSGDSFPDKYKLNSDQMLFVMKKKWDENVYCGMKMESRAVTFPQTRTILDGLNVPSVSLDDIVAIRNMRDAWKLILSSRNVKPDFEFICKLNACISRNESLEWGVLRTGNVGISGSSYKPGIPERQKVEGNIGKIISSYATSTEKALDLFCYITYNQLFWDGNKRTALTAANKILTDSGCGILTVKDQDMEEFNKALLNMYETGEKAGLKEFLYRNAISGIDF